MRPVFNKKVPLLSRRGLHLINSADSTPCITGFILSHQEFRQSPNCQTALGQFMLY